MRNKLLVILGATSTGKTDVALDFAKKLNGEIISADSRQVYKYLDIGTGKMPSQLSSIKYQISRGRGLWIVNGIKIWMYDVVNPEVRFNLYEYITEAQEVLKNIERSEKLLIIVGGTGLYIRSLLEGISDFGTDEDSKLRETLEDLTADEIADKILLSSPETHKKLNESEIKNQRRLVRIYEKLLSPHESVKKFNGIAENYDVLKIGLTADIKILRERIKKRLIKRINQGMIEESQRLLARGILTKERMEQLGLEYRYIEKYLNGEIKTEAKLIEVLSLKIGQYAKRQLTWFKREKGVIWFDVTYPEALQELDSAVLNWYNI